MQIVRTISTADLGTRWTAGTEAVRQGSQDRCGGVVVVVNHCTFLPKLLCGSAIKAFASYVDVDVDGRADALQGRAGVEWQQSIWSLTKLNVPARPFAAYVRGPTITASEASMSDKGNRSGTHLLPSEEPDAFARRLQNTPRATCRTPRALAQAKNTLWHLVVLSHPRGDS